MNKTQKNTWFTMFCVTPQPFPCIPCMTSSYFSKPTTSEHIISYRTRLANMRPCRPCMEKTHGEEVDHGTAGWIEFHLWIVAHHPQQHPFIYRQKSNPLKKVKNFQQPYRDPFRKICHTMGFRDSWLDTLCSSSENMTGCSWWFNPSEKY